MIIRYGRTDVQGHRVDSGKKDACKSYEGDNGYAENDYEYIGSDIV